MPSFGDMLEVVDLFQVKAISVREDRCVAVRNRNSKCRKCADACISQAITVNRNELSIDPGKCVNCGCCVSACPVGALNAVEPSREKVEADACKAGDASSGMAVFACARKAAKREGDPEKYVEVPCLGHLLEEELLRMAAAGFDDLVLVDGGCESCKFGAASAHIDETVENAARLLDGCESDAIVTRASEFPPEAIDSEQANARGKSRRGIIRQTGSYVKTVAGNVAQKTLDERLGRNAEPTSLRDRLKVGKSGHLPTFKPEGNYRILEAMEKLGVRSTLSEGAEEPEGGGEVSQSESSRPWLEVRDASSEALRSSAPSETACIKATSNEGIVIDTRRFGAVEIDPEKCSGCGMCVMFCPTGALKFDEFDEPENPDRRYLEFQAADCTQCMLCKDVCLRYCIEVGSKVPLRELLDFEPRLIEIAKPPNATSLNSFRLRTQK